jgi:purine nucleosidase
LIFMGGSLSPDISYREFAENPRHEFNFWFDPEAAQIVLRAPWKRVVCTPTDISIKTRFSPEMAKRIGTSNTASAQYVARYYRSGGGEEFMWDELAAAAWLDPTLITKKETRYMSVDVDKGAGYGNTLTSETKDPSTLFAQPVEIQLDLDKGKFYDMFMTLMQSPTPAGH